MLERKIASLEEDLKVYVSIYRRMIQLLVLDLVLCRMVAINLKYETTMI